MIHYWECRRCTHSWQTCCLGGMLDTEEERNARSRRLSSRLCTDCFKQLEKGEIRGLELFELSFYLENKSHLYGGRGIPDWVRNTSQYSGMCHDYKPYVYDGNTILEKGNFESGVTAEHEQLRDIHSAVFEVYYEVIKDQRTEKRIELDEFQNISGFIWLGPQPRPEGFVGDPPGEVEFTVLFGFDPASGEFVPPTIIAEDGNGGL